MSYLDVKTFHIFSMVLLFGTGLGSAFYKWMADRSGQLEHIVVTNRNVVLADWLFTTPTVLFQPLSGLWLVSRLDLPLTTPWVAAALSLYLFSVVCWLPVVWLQIRMRDISAEALHTGKALPQLYKRFSWLWFWLGVPAFFAMVLVVVIMVGKHIPGTN